MRNNIIHGNSATELEKLDDESIDCVICSPPYDSVRTYDGFDFNFEKIATELYRVMKTGRTMAWIVGDQTKDFCESLTSFKQAIFFVDVLGFKLDTMIYEKTNSAAHRPFVQKSYNQWFDYMFILTKGKSPEVFNPLMDRKNLYVNKKTRAMYRMRTGETVDVGGWNSQTHGLRSNVWKYSVGLYKTTKDKWAFDCPALMPEQLAEDLVLSYSNPGDLILDPFCGGGTVPKMAKINKRDYLGIEISERFAKLSEKRVREGHGRNESNTKPLF